jgi:hypothetical protein
VDKGLKKLLIALGIVVVIGSIVGTVVLFWVQKKVTEVAKDAADGGLVMVSPPEVVAELAGPKKAWVGEWRGVGNASTLDIDAQGNVKLVRITGSSTEKLTAPIAAFVGNDMEFRAVIKLTIPVSEAPHEVGDHWEMTAKGVKLRR